MTQSEQKIHVGVLFGGRSAEHEVSLQSAKNVIDAIDKNRYDVSLIGIDKSGKWHLSPAAQYLRHENDPKRIALEPVNKQMALVPGDTQRHMVDLSGDGVIPPLDVVFPVLHGPFGEDGTMQGLLKLADIPFVGAGVLGSAVGMDKDVAKRLMRDAGIASAHHVAFRRHELDGLDVAAAARELGLPCFVKPANLGSSVGISKAKTEEELQEAIEEAFRYDSKILVEKFIEGREIECAVLGNENPEASVLGEIVPHSEFYSYDAKYVDEDGAGLVIPAPLPDNVTAEVQRLAVRTFKVLECEGMARADFFVTKDNKIYANEINTIPGFTKISMYPKLWEASGVPYAELIDRLIQLALQRHERDKGNVSSHSS